MKSSTTQRFKILSALILIAGIQVSEAQYTDLTALDLLGTGPENFTADSQTFSAYVEQHGGKGWLLVGRGRNGWQMDTDGQGSVNDVVNHGTPSEFAPAMYSDAIVNELISNTGINLREVEIRLKRASDTTGTADFQELRWRPQSQTAWTGDFDGVAYGVRQQILSGLGGPHPEVTVNTRDQLPAVGNNANRAFTWSWGGHGGQQGFSYGQTIQGVDNNDPFTFLWENTTENHAIPYTEVYIRFDGAALGRIAAPEPSTTMSILFGACMLGIIRRLRREMDARKVAQEQS